MENISNIKLIDLFKYLEEKGIDPGTLTVIKDEPTKLKGDEVMDKLLLTELRVLRGEDDNLKSDDEPNLELALVDNENLNALGYNLKGEGIAKLAKDYTANPELTPLHVRVKEFQPDIEASPMYPNFPIQVLEMDELEFRVHQVLHYLTTYGMEDLLGVEVHQGWLPHTETLMERKDDKQVANLRTLDYLTSREINELVIKNLIGRKERLLPNEIKIAKAVVKRHGRPDVEEIPFKENIGAIYGDTLLNGELEYRYEVLSELTRIMKHPGDVLDLVENLVIMNNYKHLKTSLKRGLVDLLEGFPTDAIEENLASNRWSNKFLGKGGKRRSVNRNIALIDYMSFSKFSKNAAAMNVVNELKDGKLLSWNQNLERAYHTFELDEVMRLLEQRPGIYFRQINRLFKNGVPAYLMSKDVKKFASELKTQSIVSALNNFEGDSEVDQVFYDALVANLLSKDVEEIAGKKVFVEQNEIDYNSSKLAITDKIEEGGYIQSGMAIKIPEDARFVRFFTYWGDKNKRIDIDLHAAYEKEGDDNGHIGWNGSKNNHGLVYSGDITKSDSAEYIDIDLKDARERGVNRVQFNINSYTGIKFKDIETMFTGLMVLGEMGQKVKLYDQKNVLFRHDLENNSMATNYGLLDLEKGLIRIIGTNSQGHNDEDLIDDIEVKLSIRSYLSILLATQGCKVVKDRKDADIVLGLGKADEENHVSLVDNNFFM